MEQLISGVVSGVIASVIFAVILIAIKPRMKISDNICISKTDEGLIIAKIKIVNFSRRMLTNMKYTLHYCVGYDDGLTDITEIVPKKNFLTTVAAFSKKNTDYAVRISYEWDNKKYPMEENTRFVFTLQGTHPFSNTSKCIKREYRKNDLKIADFETGKSCKFILRH